MTQIITHRGLDPSIPDFPFESSLEAFKNHLILGYGIEFDPRRSTDGYVVLHDQTLTRITGGEDSRKVSDVPVRDLLAIDLAGSQLVTLHDVLALISDHGAEGIFSAIHLKHEFQADIKNLDVLVDEISSFNLNHLILFDVTINTAKYLKGRNNTLKLAPSVAHPYDIERYGASVGNTLLSVKDALSLRDLFDWVWLDEWDRLDANNADKKLYTKEVFDKFREAGMRIALVTPELHRTSPGLIGGEAHSDAENLNTLKKRLEEIIALKPDAICTDYPDLTKQLIKA